MKTYIKIIIVVVLLLFVASICYPQESNIAITLYDTAQINFMNKVEVKLLKHINALQNDKIKPDITLFDVSPRHNSAHWIIPMTKDETKMDTLPKERISTNSFSLSVLWNYNLDTGYVIGFSRMYFHQCYNWYSMGTFNWPIYEVPLIEYTAFLSDEEMKIVYEIIKTEFVKYVSGIQYGCPNCAQLVTDYYYYPTDDSMSRRTLSVSSGDSLLPQFSLTNSVKIIKSALLSGEMEVFSQPL